MTRCPLTRSSVFLLFQPCNNRDSQFLIDNTVGTEGAASLSIRHLIFTSGQSFVLDLLAWTEETGLRNARSLMSTKSELLKT